MNRRNAEGLAIAALAAVLLAVLPALTAQSQDKAEAALKAAMDKEVVDGNLKAAIEQYKKLAEGANKQVAARALVRLGECYEKQGNADARKTYEQVLSKFGDQKEAVAQARARLAAMGGVKASGEVSTRKVEEFSVLSISNDGRYLAYADQESGELGLRDLSSGEHRLLTHDSAKGAKGYVEDGAQFSPDGRQVAYIWQPDGDAGLELRVIASSGSAQPRVVFRCDNEITWLIPSAWTPDGKSLLSLLLAQAGGKTVTRIATIDAADGKVREFKSLDGAWSVGNPKISPDGAYITYVRALGAGSQQQAIMILSTSDLRESLLVGSPANQPVWMADGRAILFLSNRRGAMDLWQQRMDRGQPQDSPEPMRTEVGNISLLGISQTGVLAYNSRSNMSYAYTAPFDPAAGRAGQPVRLSERAIGPTAPVWSPDGKTLALFRTQQLVLHTLATGAEREFPLNLSRPTLSGWFPDGRSVLISGNAQGKQVSVRFYFEPPHAEPLPPLGAEFIRRSISPDGKTVYFGGADLAQKRMLINAVDVASGEVREVWHVPSFRSLALSHDGRQLAYIEGPYNDKPDVLYVLDVSGGQPRKVLEFPRPSFAYGALQWFPDGRHLLVSANFGANGAKYEIHWISVDSGTSQNTGVANESMFNGISVSPDGRQLAFEGGVRKREAWVMENFLPAAKAAPAAK